MAIRDDAERERSDGLVVASIVEAYTFERLDELRRFRHFKRYYYRLDYDWDKLDFVVKKLVEVHKTLHDDLSKFVQFLGNLE